jgi:hypothetical protein
MTAQDITALLQEARSAEAAWTRAQQTGRRNSRTYQQAYLRKLAAHRALLTARLQHTA